MPHAPAHGLRNWRAFGTAPVAPPSRSAEVRLAALALGATAVTAAVCLLFMFAGVPALGPVNDHLNALVGWLALALAVLVRRREGARWPADAAVAAAAVGAVVLTLGSWLVVSGATGYYLAGLVSSLGLAATGAALLLARPSLLAAGPVPAGTDRLLRLSGWCMAAGVLALPAALAGVDDPASAPPYVWVGEGLAWLGFYGLLPVWSLRLARRPGRP